MKYKETTFKEFYQCPVGVLRLKLAFKPEAGPRHEGWLVEIDFYHLGNGFLPPWNLFIF